MPTGTVTWVNDDRGRGLITPDDGSEDLIANFSAVRMSRSQTLREGQRVRFVITEGPEGKEASEIEYHALAGHLTPHVHVQECLIDGPEPIERTLYLDLEPIAVTYLDKPATEATLAWPLWSNASLQPVLDCYLTEVLPRFHPHSSENVLEFWIGNQYNKTEIGPEPNSRLVLEIVRSRMTEELGSLELLQIASESAVMELLFDESNDVPVRLALLMSAVPFDPLVRLFSRFHKNDIVRKNPEIAACAFAPSVLRSSKNLLYPLLILTEENSYAQLEG